MLRGCFDPVGRHRRARFNRSSRLFPPLWLCFVPRYKIILQSPTSNANSIVSQRSTWNACESVRAEVCRATCALPCRWSVKELPNWRPARAFRFTAAPWQDTHAHKYTQLVISALRLCDFSKHVIARSRVGVEGLASHVRLSPSDHSSEARKSAAVSETQRADWSQIGTRPSNQRDMLCYVVELKRVYYRPQINYLRQQQQ